MLYQIQTRKYGCSSSSCHTHPAAYAPKPNVMLVKLDCYGADSHSLYVHNLEERVRPDHLSSALETLFAQYGTILDINIKTSVKRKGQAFIIYDSIESASRALEEAQGFPLFDKPLVIEYAKTPSDAVVELGGDANELENHKRHRLAEKGPSNSNWCMNNSNQSQSGSKLSNQHWSRCKSREIQA